MPRSSLVRTGALCALVLAAGTSTGCIAVAAGAAAGYGAYKMSSNGESRTYSATLPVVWSASLATLRENGFPIDDSAPLGPTGGRLSMNGLTLDVDKESEGMTRVTVKLGTFDTADHRVHADTILDGISRRLGVAP